MSWALRFIRVGVHFEARPTTDVANDMVKSARQATPSFIKSDQIRRPMVKRKENMFRMLRGE